MKKVKKSEHLGIFLNILIFVLFFILYRQAIAWILSSYAETASYEYGVVFAAFLIIIIFFIYKNRGKLTELFCFQIQPVLLGILIILLSLDLLNTVFLHYNIVSALLFFCSLYFLIGFYLRNEIWKRGFWIIALFCLTLPFAEHLQTFVGFPVRLLTAKIVSLLMHFLGQSNVTDATIIITENNATSIDLPCSGVNSIYIGTFFMLFVYFLKKVRPSLKLIGASILFYLVILFFNTWRVFSLIYIYDVLKLASFGNAIHVGLGMFGFAISCVFLWILTNRFLLEKNIGKKKISKNLAQDKKLAEKVVASGFSFKSLSIEKQKNSLFLIIFIFAIFSELNLYGLKNGSGEIPATKLQNSASINFNLPSYQLTEIPFSEKEKTFFQNREVEFSKKYTGLTESKIPFTLLLVKSKSWRTHHNPEICLQGLGYSIDESKILRLDDISMRQLKLNGGKASVFYWFSGKEQTLNDYSERVWEGILHPNDEWVLVEVGFDREIKIEGPEIVNLIKKIQSNVKFIMLR